ncbi:MAG: radical SAM protein [bacterium]|nr:radical SAM protein [bacterium]
MMNEYVKNLNRIEFVVTMACTGKCKHCSEGGHSACAGHIDADAAAKAICEVCRNYKIESLMTFGGEPLLYPDVVCKIHETAKTMGIQKRDLITNGFFTKDKKRIREVVESLSRYGVENILLSVDAFHQETIPLEIVQYFANVL